MLYLLLKEKFHLENKQYTTYGIQAMHNGNIIRKISDVSLKLEEINQFVNLLNANNLKITHLDEVIEDFLIG